MRIMVTGGGTGGHTSPLIAVYEELKKRDPVLRLQWVGCRGRIEERLSKQMGIPFRSVPVAGWPRKRGIRQIWVGAKLVLSLARSAVLLRSFHPQLVFGVGGYVSLPLMLVAQWLGIPTIIHEQNRRLGMANRMLAPKATQIFLSFDDTIGDFPADRAEVVGNPVRPEFVAPLDMASARQQLDLNLDDPVVLVCGGSQGAHQINEAMLGGVEQLCASGTQVIWVTGPQEYEKAQAYVASISGPIRVHGFIDDMATACRAADIIVGRAGASTTAELAVLGKPCILIPYPLATDNHQMRNAQAFEAVNGGRILEDKDCTASTLVAALEEMLQDRSALEAMGRNAKTLAKPMAGERIAESIIESLFGNEVSSESAL